VAVEGGEVIGFVILIAQPGYLLLDNVAVRPDVQCRGIGTRLLDLAEDHARNLHLGEVRLYTNEAMTENLSYYPRHGYVETHRAEQDGFRRVSSASRWTDPLAADAPFAPGAAAAQHPAWPPGCSATAGTTNGAESSL
jgi:ribosomal protein S18 acetylase RimI-like enzyme